MEHENQREILDDGSCPEYRELTRRALLRRAGPLAIAPALVPRVALAGAQPAGPRDVLVHVSLRGGMDPLTACVPYGDPDLYVHRPTLAIQPPGSTDGATDLDGFFGLPPSGVPLLTPYLNGHLAFVHATGSPDLQRSHFKAIRLMEFGTPGQVGGPTSGWLARHLASVPPVQQDAPLRAMAFDDFLPQSLDGAPRTLPVLDPSDYRFVGNQASIPARRAALTKMWGDQPAPLGPSALTVFETIDLLETIDFNGYVPIGGAVYPNIPLAHQLENAAALIKADVGVEAISIDYDGWDHHANLGPLTGKFSVLYDRLTRSLEAFYLDMLGQIDQLVVVVQTEFGRRVAENASDGADHGYGGVMILIGGHVAGGQVITNWPGLSAGNLVQGDLAITIDYRDVLGEILEQRMGNSNLATVFPAHAPLGAGVVV